MIEALRAQLEAALVAMDRGFHVSLIGTFGEDLVCAPADANADTWLAANCPEFDHFPVRNASETVGILQRHAKHGDRSVREAMQPLREGLLVSAHMSIAELIPQLRESPYRLVLRGGQIDGLVTQSDLLKLPVRLVTFCLITHLEQVMAGVIAQRWRDNEWLPLLSQGRQDKIRKKRADLSGEKMDPPTLELTEFADKRDLCRRLVEGSKSKFGRDLEKLRTLRDQLAHAASFIDLPHVRPDVREFVDRFESAKYWIQELTDLADRIRGES